MGTRPSRKRALLQANKRMSQRNRKTAKVVSWHASLKGSSWFFSLELLAISAGLAGLLLSYQEIKQAAEDRELEGIARSWAILGTVGSGNSGKVQALEFLASKGQPLVAIDLSCERMGGLVGGSCQRPTYLEGLDLGQFSRSNDDVWDPSIDGPYVRLERANFSGANLWNANFVDVGLEKADFSDASLENANFSNSDLYSTVFRGANLTSVDLSRTSLINTSFNGANLSRTDFSNTINETLSDFENSWAWADKLPIDLEPSIGPHFVCIFDDGEFSERSVRGQNCTQMDISPRNTTRRFD